MAALVLVIFGQAPCPDHDHEERFMRASVLDSVGWCWIVLESIAISGIHWHCLGHLVTPYCMSRPSRGLPSLILVLGSVLVSSYRPTNAPSIPIHTRHSINTLTLQCSIQYTRNLQFNTRSSQQPSLNRQQPRARTRKLGRPSILPLG